MCPPPLQRVPPPPGNMCATPPSLCEKAGARRRRRSSLHAWFRCKGNKPKSACSFQDPILDQSPPELCGMDSFPIRDREAAQRQQTPGSREDVTVPIALEEGQELVITEPANLWSATARVPALHTDAASECIDPGSAPRSTRLHSPRTAPPPRKRSRWQVRKKY